MNDDIKESLEVLKRGGVILYPTDTIWGLGCDATNAEAVKKVYDIKRRSDTKSMLVLLNDAAFLTYYVHKVPDIAYELINVADKPLTIIYPGAKNLAENLIPSDGSIGIRIPNDFFCKKLISQFKKPIVSTSANFTEKPAPGNFGDLDSEILNAVDYVVTWRQDELTRNIPSSIIKLGVNGEIQIIRK